ncbi:MAG: hypothetical protein QM479_07150 [Pseudomonadota bacterium]
MKNNSLLFILCTSLLLSTHLAAKTFKCWTNEEGIRECGNSLPPQYVNQRIEFFNEKSGTMSTFIPAAKTQQQIFSEKAQEKILKRQQKEQAKQKAYDDVLLKTYLTVDDLLLSLHWKITTLNSNINVTKGSIRTENVNFMLATQKAAKIERAGKKLSEDIKQELQSSRNLIKNYKLRIKMLEQDKTDIHQKFSHDVDRFTIATINGLTLTLRNDEKAQELEMIQLTCTEKKRCDKMWQAAKTFVAENSSLDIIFDTAQVRTTVSPAKVDDMAFTVSRATSTYDNVKSEKITLKIRCQPSRAGKKLCNSPKMINTLQQFKKDVQK